MSLIILTAHSVSQERKLKELENHPPHLMKFYLATGFYKLILISRLSVSGFECVFVRESQDPHGAAAAQPRNYGFKHLSKL